MKNAQAELSRPWPQEAEWKQKSERLERLNAELSAEVRDGHQESQAEGGVEMEP